MEWLFKPVCVSQALVESRQTEQSQGRAKISLPLTWTTHQPYRVHIRSLKLN